MKAGDLRSVTLVEEDNLIPTEKLTLADVPSTDAELQAVEEFCLTVDGYQGDRFSIEDLVSLARRVESRGLENATLDDLRTTAFIHQRHLRWTTCGDEAGDAPLVRKILDTVAEIRRRLGG